MVDPSTLTDDELRKAYPLVNWEKVDTEQARFVLGKTYEAFRPKTREELEAKRQEMIKNG